MEVIKITNKYDKSKAINKAKIHILIRHMVVLFDLDIKMNKKQELIIYKNEETSTFYWKANHLPNALTIFIKKIKQFYLDQGYKKRRN